MPGKIYNNVVDHAVINDGAKVEDVTSVELPTVESETSEFGVAGMAGKVEMPDTTTFKAMELSVSHNNGVNCHLLATPGKHNIEVRIARQRMDVVPGELGYASDKYRITCVEKSSKQGTVERGNPLGGTVAYSVLRYEHERDGSVLTLIDMLTGTVRINGVDYSSVVKNMLE